MKEIGFKDHEGNPFTVELTQEGKRDPLFEGLDHSFEVFHLHGETVELTPECTLLGVGRFCQNQVVRVGSNAYGIQCHFELTAEMFRVWLNEDPDLVTLDKEELQWHFNSISKKYTEVGRQLFQNFLTLAGF